MEVTATERNRQGHYGCRAVTGRLAFTPRQRQVHLLGQTALEQKREPTNYAAESEAAHLAEIRKTYLPEVLLAYNSVLHFAGHAISREMLLKSMDFAASVAAQGSDVAACFVSAGRMRELVDALAMTSKAILKANEHGSTVKKGRKKASYGQSLSLWTVKGL